jgi:pimeloyl-ACP methyl ester carboxylesterase
MRAPSCRSTLALVTVGCDAVRDETACRTSSREVGMGGLGYDETGAGDPALLFLHGWCGDRSFFAPQFEHFSRSHRVVSVDLPGHGQSTVPDEYAIDAFASQVAELAGELDLGRSVVFGHSIGAMVALALSQLAPELVGALALIDPPPLSKEVWKGFAPQLITSFSGPDGPTGRRQFVEQMFLPTDDTARRAKIIATMTAVPNDIAIPLVEAIAAFDAMAVLRQCEVPVVTISSAVPTNDPATLLAANPTMTFGQTVGAGHFLQLEVPEQVNPMIERFLAILPGGALAAPQPRS